MTKRTGVFGAAMGSVAVSERVSPCWIDVGASRKKLGVGGGDCTVADGVGEHPKKVKSSSKRNADPLACQCLDVTA
jgi:hypothetical protein